MAKSVVPSINPGVTDSSGDPIKIMIEIAENTNLTDEDKTSLIEYSKERFKNRRRMAYISLTVIVVTVTMLLIGALIDGLTGKTKILETIKDNGSLLTWLNGFLTSIIGAYYGATALRPTS